MTPAEQIAAYHAMRAPANLAEHLTAAELLGLDLDEREMMRDGRRTGPTLRERIAASWQPTAAPTHPRAAPPARGVPLARPMGPVIPIRPVA